MSGLPRAIVDTILEGDYARNLVRAGLPSGEIRQKLAQIARKLGYKAEVAYLPNHSKYTFQIKVWPDKNDPEPSKTVMQAKFYSEIVPAFGKQLEHVGYPIWGWTLKPGDNSPCWLELNVKLYWI